MPQSKTIVVALAGSGRQLTVEIQPGTTAQDLLEQLNLDGRLYRLGETVPFGDSESLYAAVRDGEKVVCSPKTPVAP